MNGWEKKSDNEEANRRQLKSENVVGNRTLTNKKPTSVNPKDMKDPKPVILNENTKHELWNIYTLCCYFVCACTLTAEAHCSSAPHPPLGWQSLLESGFREKVPL